MKKISIVSACYKEASNIPEFYNRVTAILKQNPSYDYEIIIVDNASPDNSREVLEALTKKDSHVKAIIMARNFGSSQPSLWAGMRNATGDCVIILDGDLQDPPELITDFIKKWEDGFDVVYGIRKKRKGGILRRIGYKCFYRLFHWLSYLDIPLDAGDFSLIDKKVVDVIINLPEKDLYIRGLRTWAGFKQIGIEYTRDERAGGKTSNSFFANFFWAKKAIVNFSFKPLEFISRMAALACIFTMIATGIYLYLHFKNGAPKGFSTLLMVILILGTIQLLALSIIGEYLIRIFQEVKGRPPYVIGEILTQETIKKH